MACCPMTSHPRNGSVNLRPLLGPALHVSPHRVHIPVLLYTVTLHEDVTDAISINTDISPFGHSSHCRSVILCCCVNITQCTTFSQRKGLQCITLQLRIRSFSPAISPSLLSSCFGILFMRVPNISAAPDPLYSSVRHSVQPSDLLDGPSWQV